MQKDIISEILGDYDESEINNNNNVFFTDDGSEGYFTKAEFITALRGMRGKPALKQLKLMFDNMNLKKDLMGIPKEDNLNGQTIIWVRFHFGKVKQNLPVPNFGRMHDFCMDYANGVIKDVKTLEELIVDASSAED